MNYTFDVEKLKNGIIGVKSNDFKKNINGKVFTKKNNSPEYHYTLTENGKWYYLPLQHGNGEYIIETYMQEKASESNYFKISSNNYNIRTIIPNIVWLQSNIYIPWNIDMKCIKMAKTLKGTNQNKISNIWEFIVNNFEYDYDLLNKIRKTNTKYNYTPDIEKTFLTKRDICFGLTALFNSMLRSIGIPCKMHHGYTNDSSRGYHAWSEIFLSNKWITADITDGIIFKQEKLKPINTNGYEIKFSY